jgi:hypothetical protein
VNPGFESMCRCEGGSDTKNNWPSRNAERLFLFMGMYGSSEQI